MRNRIIVVLCILLIGVLGCSDFIYYDPGFQPVQEEISVAEHIEDAPENISNNAPPAVATPHEDSQKNQSAH